MSSSVPYLGSIILSQVGQEIDIPMVTGIQNLPGETEELLTKVISGLIHFDKNLRRHTSLYNGGVCGYRASLHYGHIKYLWSEDEPNPDDDFQVAIYAIAIRDTKELQPKDNLRFEVRPIVGQRRHPWHPAEGGTFQQLCPGDYILLRISILKKNRLDAAFVSDSVFKYTEKDQATLLEPKDMRRATFSRTADFFESVDDLATQHYDLPFYQSRVHDVLEGWPHNPFVAPTTMRRDRQETQKLIDKFNQLLSITFSRGKMAAIPNSDGTLQKVLLNEDVIKKLEENFQLCAQNTAHQFWAAAITKALAGVKQFKVSRLPMFLTNSAGDEQTLTIRIGKRELKVELTLWDGPKVRATYEDPNKQQNPE